jgi:hypothetical protein
VNPDTGESGNHPQSGTGGREHRSRSTAGCFEDFWAYRNVPGQYSANLKLRSCNQWLQHRCDGDRAACAIVLCAPRPPCFVPPRALICFQSESHR